MAVLTSKERFEPRSPVEKERFENMKVYRRGVGVEK
jgi:hypothetical protein